MSYLYVQDYELPDDIKVPKRYYNGPHIHAAITCLEAGNEEGAASWMWRDMAEEDHHFHPMAGSLEIKWERSGRHIYNSIIYTDAEDVGEQLIGLAGDGI